MSVWLWRKWPEGQKQAPSEPLSQYFPRVPLAPTALLNETIENSKLLSHPLEFTALLIHWLS